MRKKLRSMTVGLSAAGMYLMSGVPVLAAKEEKATKEIDIDVNNFDVKNIGDYDSGAFDGLKKTVISQGGAAYNLLIIFGIVAILISVIIFGLTMLIFKGGSDRDEHKSKAFTIALAISAIFGATGIVSLARGVFGV